MTHDSQPSHKNLRTPLPPATPKWITPELVELTLRTWQRYYSHPLTVEEAIDMIRNAGRMFDAFSGK